jgi:hypothetical protein
MLHLMVQGSPIVESRCHFTPSFRFLHHTSLPMSFRFHSLQVPGLPILTLHGNAAKLFSRQFAPFDFFSFLMIDASRYFSRHISGRHIFDAVFDGFKREH